MKVGGGYYKDSLSKGISVQNHSDTPVVGLENLRTALLSRLQEAIDGFD